MIEVAEGDGSTRREDLEIRPLASRAQVDSGAGRRGMSTHSVGLAYELLVHKFLVRSTSSGGAFGLALLHRGGAGDGGVDLRGLWDVPALARSSPTEEAGRRKLQVVVQCKAFERRLSPAVVRELEGTILALRHSPGEEAIKSKSDGIIGIIVSQSGFSGATIKRALSSNWPIVLLHLAPHPVEDPLDDISSFPTLDLVSSSSSPTLVHRLLSIVVNKPLQTLLGNRFELRWAREFVDGKRRERPLVHWRT